MEEKISDSAKIQQEFDDFVYIVSHDLKAPLRGIKNISEWIEEDLPDSVPQDVLDNFKLLKDRTERVNGMMDVLNEYSRINRRELELAEVDMLEMATAIKDELEFEQGQLTVKLLGEPIVFTTYKNKLRKVITKAVENAGHHNQGKEVIVTISWEKSDLQLMVKVADNGQGVPASNVNDITRLFYTILPKEKTNRIGFGLTYINKVVDFVGGELKITTDQDKGFTAEITWPLNLSE